MCILYNGVCFLSALVAAVDKNTGVLTAVSNGTCVITVTTDDVTKSSATCSVTVHLHEWSNEWTITDTHHWHSCVNAGCNITANTEKYARATGYEVYWSYCDGKQNYRLLGSVKKLKYTHKNLKKDRAYKYYVIAYKKIGKKKVYLCKSPSIHVAMSYDKHTNVKKIKTNISNLTLKMKETFQIEATLTKQDKSKQLIEHVPKIRYYTTNKKVAAVSKTGKITAKNVGQCIIYVMANSGWTKKIIVTVS